MWDMGIGTGLLFGNDLRDLSIALRVYEGGGRRCVLLF